MERAKPEERTKVIDNVPPHVNTIDVEAKASIISVDAEIKASVMETMKEAFSYIVTEEMVNAYGKGLWLDIIIKKPPWSLKGNVVADRDAHFLSFVKVNLKG